MLNTLKIRLIVPYYGTWPVYFPLYLAALRRNPILDVLFFTDLPLPADAPENCSKVDMSLAELEGRARTMIDPTVRIDRPYKLCDFKPAYGELFADYIGGFSHWACGDIDVIYGDVAATLPAAWRNFDILSFRREWLSGSFAVFRNSPEINGLYRTSSSFPECLRDARHLGFDECFGLYSKLIYRDADDVLAIDDRQSFSWVIRMRASSIRVFQETLIAESLPPGSRLEVSSKGIQDADGKPYLLYHLIDEKKSPYFSFARWQSVPSSYTIDRFGFLSENEAHSPVLEVRRLRRLCLGFLKNCVRRASAFLHRSLPSRRRSPQ